MHGASRSVKDPNSFLPVETQTDQISSEPKTQQLPSTVDPQLNHLFQNPLIPKPYLPDMLSSTHLCHSSPGMTTNIRWGKLRIQTCLTPHKNWPYVTFWMLGSLRNIYIYIYIYIFTSRHQHVYPWLSLAIPPYRTLLPVGLQGYIPYQHRATVCRSKLVVLPLLVHVKKSTGVHH